MKRFWLLYLTVLIALSACGTLAPTVEPRTLTVFAAASLTDAFGELGTAFETHYPGVSVTFNFGGSQALRTQIEQGAQVDVFASANIKEMDTLVADNLVAAESPQLFLTNQLVVIMPASNSARLQELADLARSGLKLVLAAQEVPVGNYSLQALDKLDAAFGNGFKDKVLANVVSYENDVKQIVAKVQLGEADAGMVYLSDTVAAPELQKLDIPAENNVIARYPLAALAQTKNPELSQAFIDFVLSTEGQSILKKWGFLPVN
jgi:molybdate transport system substrate-binding protein